MLVNLLIIGCFILSAILMYIGVSIIVDLITPEPLRSKRSFRLPRINPFRNIPLQKKGPVSGAGGMNLRELNH